MKGKLMLAAALLMILGALACLRTVAPGKPKPQHAQAPLVGFSYAHRGSTYDSFYVYEVKEINGSYRFCYLPMSEDGIQTAVLKEADAATLLELIERHQLWEWDGFDETAKSVRDGTGFSLTISFADGTAIKANGSNAFPPRHSELLHDMKTLFSSYYSMNP